MIRRESAARKELFEVDAALDDVLDVQVVVEQVAQDAVDSRALLGGKMDGYAVAFCVDGDAELFFEIPSNDLVFAETRALLGGPVEARFGQDFPIRFDFLDTDFFKYVICYFVILTNRDNIRDNYTISIFYLRLSFSIFNQ